MLPEFIQLPEEKKIYFISDLHLGINALHSSASREKQFVAWLNEAAQDAHSIIILGDLFDFWFDYKHVVPRGFTRVLGKLAELGDQGIKLYFFTGNHDMWMFDYFEKELNIPIIKTAQVTTINKKKFFIAHGDGLGPGDYGYKFIKSIFANKICQFLFRLIHPDFGIALANFWSRKSRKHTAQEEESYQGDEKEMLFQFAKESLQKTHYDYFIFGHRHLPIDKNLDDKARYINLGDWLSFYTYAVFDGTVLALKKFDV